MLKGIKKMAENMTFEKALARLEEIVRTMESGAAQLDKSLALFEEGVSLVKFCTSELDNAEQKVNACFPMVSTSVIPVTEDILIHPQNA